MARRSWWPVMNWRTLRYGSQASLFTAGMLAVVVVLYTLAVKHDRAVDVTRSQRFTLAAQSLKLLQELREPVKVLGFFRLEDVQRNAFVDLLQLYIRHTDKITYTFVDFDRNPGLAERYHITSSNTVLVTGYGKEEKIFQLEEEALTNAILKLTRETQKVVYFVTGHGEAGLADTERNGYSIARQRLQTQHYKVKDLLLTQNQQIPDDAAVLIVAGPHTDLLEQELAMLTAFVERGGRLLFLLDPGTVPGLIPFLRRYGLELGDDMIIEPNSLLQLLGGDYLMPAVIIYDAQHPIVKDFHTQMTIFPMVRSVRLATTLPEGIRAQTLAFTSADSWAETDLDTLEQEKRSTFDEQRDRQGPVSIAAVVAVHHPAGRPVRGSDRTPPAQLVVFGDSEFANNSFFTLQGNGDLFLNAVSWLAEEDNLIAIRPRPGGGSGPVILSAAQEPLIFWISVVLLPLAVLVCGVVVCGARRWLP